MKPFILLSCIAIFLACQNKPEPAVPAKPVIVETPPDEVFPPSAYTQLIWSDEFDGSIINLTKWQHEINDNGGGNNELQYYTAEPANSFVKDGNLVIEAIKETYKTRSYTSARLNTKNKADFKYGKIEVRAKLPKGQGVWPAIWMLPTDEEFGGWPKSGEIDIMELVGHKANTVHGTVHYGQAWPNNQYKGTFTVLPAGDFSNDFHVFSIVWERNLIRWYLDETQFFSIKPADLSPHHYPFNARFHLLLNVAVGGNWPGNPDATTVFPQRMLVDYVRVYQRKE
ncbi:glycoside hydrolase family 16 protein [Rhodocytophaga rosea]|uniref:Glycoside hydrolase family 16 protein n=1 Tax=Rhodocytophaga rosea TaxID=2704465 RepID=A0A6C0GD43_9BACT|nr:glycoside hydrolase family 16 protein [Rhodocytophaga rosea]QHT65808.1 glycoside hydrolase family 16 protein [Rhodocytophaga rosea]